MPSGEIRLYAGEAVTYTITVMRDGTAVDLTNHEASGSAVLSAWDEAGTKVVDNVACTFVTAASGIISFAFTTTHTTVPSSKTDLKGGWRVTISDGAGTIEKTAPGQFLVSEDKGA